MTADPIRLALAAYLSEHRIKLVHTWQTAGAWSAMMEWPYDPTRRKPLPTEIHATGVGSDTVAAVLAALDRMGHNRLLVRLYLCNYLLGTK